MTEHPPLCPRCGYDQHGTIDTWGDACPVHGLCSECGLGFEWGDVLNPYRGRLPGLVEHSRGVQQLVRWTFTTMGWMILPHRFWSRVGMHHAVSLRRILLGPLIVAAVVHVAAGLLGCVTMACSPSGWSVVPVRLDNVSEWWPIAALEFAEPFAYAATWYTPSGTDLSVQWVIVQFLDRLLGLFACILAWPFLMGVLPFTRRASRLRWVHIWRAGLYPFWWAILIHIADRLIAIGNNLVALGSIVTGSAWPYRFSALFNTPVMILSNALWLAGPVWIGAWWYFAIQRGWRLEHARLLWFLLTLAALAASGLIFLGAWYARVLIDPFGTSV